MKQYSFFAALAISLLLFLSCFNHDNDPELIIEIYIQGTVKDAATGKPITDAEVTLSFEEKTLQKSKTNSKGVFTFPVSQDGNYQLFVQATGYRNAEKSFPLTNLSNNDVDINMTLANSLTITNESSYDIENVKWSNGNASFGSIKIAGSVEVPVDTGSGYVFFTRSTDKLNVHTEYVAVSQGERRKYIVADTTIVVEVGYGENKKTLGSIKTANPTPSSSSVVPSSSSPVVLPSSGSKQSSSSNAEPSSSSAASPSSSSAAVTLPSSNSVPSSSSNAPPSSSSVACTADDNTKTKYCSNGTLKEYGSMTDDGGQTYKTVVIGTQTWMAENLNYNVTGSKCGTSSNGLSDANNSTCDKYGRLYDWATAMALSSDCNSSSCSAQIAPNHRGVCPESWHIPSNDEWITLRNFIGTKSAGNKLKAANGWRENGNGEDKYGFSALPGGRGYAEGFSIYVGEGGFWYSSTESSNTAAYGLDMHYNLDDTYGNYSKDPLQSIRCVKN